MDALDKTFSELVGIIKSWIPWRSEQANVSRDFWMPDNSCRVCYECDSQFTLFNRRHHCRLCGLIFCAKCTSNYVPAPFSSQRNTWDDWEKIRVCNYCYRQWEQGIVALDSGFQVSNLDRSRSISSSSLASSKTSGTANSSNITLCSMPYSLGPYQQMQQGSCLNLNQSPMSRNNTDREGLSALGGRNDLVADQGGPLSKQYGFSTNRSDDDEDDYSAYHSVFQSDSEMRHYPQVNCYFGQVEFDRIRNTDGSQTVHPDADNIGAKLPSERSFDAQGLHGNPVIGKNEDEPDICDENEASSSLYVSEDVDAEPVDFENNGLLWLPPEPENAEDEREAILFDDDDDDNNGNAIGEWGYLRNSSNFGNGESHNRDRASEEHKKVMKNAVDSHFRALVAQLLQVENLPVEDNDENSWLDIVTSLSWEAATLLKPDTSKSGGMDPAGYVKIKCIACGSRIESVLIKGVVCKKNVAHRRMSSKFDKPRVLILGGALEYQRVTNLLSSVDTLLQQEMDHLKMAVAKIAAHQPNILVVEKSVSRYAQEYLLAKDISLVLNVKKPLLERIARCTGTQIVSSIDHLSTQKLGSCENFHVEKFLEDLSRAGQGGKKPVKTLMFFEGCPKPLGCTILLRGADEEELKKVKHVIQYGVFAAYHLALETSFLADEGVSLPEIPLNSLALPNNSSSIQRSISTVPGFSALSTEKSRGLEPDTGPRRTKSVTAADLAPSAFSTEPHLSNGGPFEYMTPRSSVNHSTTFYSSIVASRNAISDSFNEKLLPSISKGINDSKQPLVEESCVVNNTLVMNDPTINGYKTSERLDQGILADTYQNDDCKISADLLSGSELYPEDVQNLPENLEIPNEELPEKEEFPPSPSDHQSILVSLSSRCVWKGTVCERSHLFRIKYYGNFDKPLGRFLRDHLFDQSYRCHSCDMPSEAHVYCYTHRQGTLTISVKKLSEILLPGEREGKIWMWHRCLRCPRINGFPSATQRIVMSDAAWGLSLGKFLELSFSNHAAASRLASCGHSLHRDCLRFYGFGEMVACFRYASIDVHSVYLPPHQLDFDYGNQDWIQKESNEVVNRAEFLFSEVLNCISQIGEKRSSAALNSSGQVVVLEEMLQKEKQEFEETIQKVLNHEKGKGQPGIDILEINRLRRQLICQSYLWDKYLIIAANSSSETGSSSEDKERPFDEDQTSVTSIAGRGFSSVGSLHGDPKLKKSPSVGGGRLVDVKISQSHAFHQETDMTKITNHKKEYQPTLSISGSINDQSDLLEPKLGVRRALSEGPFPLIPSLSDTLDARWTGENFTGFGTQMDGTSVNPDTFFTDTFMTTLQKEAYSTGDHAEDQNATKSFYSSSKGHNNMEDSLSWLEIPFLNFYRQFNKNLFASTLKFDTIVEYNPVYLSSFRKLEFQGGAKILSTGVNNIVIPVYDDEPSSIIAYALTSTEYHQQLTDEGERPKDGIELGTSYFSDSGTCQSFSSADDTFFDSQKSFGSVGSVEDIMFSLPGSRSTSILEQRNPSMLDPMSYTKAMHARISFGKDDALGKVNYSVTCYYAKRFEALRRVCCRSDLDYVKSLSRCKKWGAQGGKSNVFFAKTLDDRFIIKQVTKTELESFIKFGPEYFKYLSNAIATGSPTCLAKILGIYQVTTKYVKGGKESKMDVLVMENLLFRRTVTRLYDLKGSSRSRYNPDSSGKNKVLLDQNLIEAMPTSPIFVGHKAKRLLERGVWNDTGFLASVDVMDYSLLVGVDEEKHELVLGIIDFMRQYTWDKHLETWVKASGILGGPKNASPTVISPKQYKKRFRKAMTTYFLMLPDQWSPSTLAPSQSQSELSEDGTQPRTPAE